MKSGKNTRDVVSPWQIAQHSEAVIGFRLNYQLHKKKPEP